MKILLGIFVVAGFLVAGSEGDYFPFVNFAGLLIMVGAALILEILEERRNYEYRTTDSSMGRW